MYKSNDSFKVAPPSPVEVWTAYPLGSNLRLFPNKIESLPTTAFCTFCFAETYKGTKK